jgi:(1->4)-alpha-D-glucan 1-alpha-D-glucosylmutase
MTPRATYRVQFNRDFPFASAEEIVTYLDRLGISHIYASPITTAVPGSQHGYDVTDPARVNPELGGEEALRSLVAALRARGMGLIIDIVPNHMGIAGGYNPYWNDVLRHGEASEYARWFDIDWCEPLLLPILGAPLPEVLVAGDVALDRSAAEPELVLYGEQRLPLRREDHVSLPEPDDRDGLAALLDRQHYRLAWWRQANDELNWRRFFTINELAGLRIEDPDVFERTHALYFRLWQEGLIDGVRIDHVDGLSDPAGYCRKLRQRFDSLARPADAPEGSAYVVVEKILGPGESLPRDWGVDGTSGYDFMEEVSAVLHDPAGEAEILALWHEFSGRALTFKEEELQARQDMLSWDFESQLRACTDSFLALARSDPGSAGWTHAMLRRSIERLLWVFPVYRTYGTGTAAPPSDAAVRKRVREDVVPLIPPGEAAVAERVLQWLGGNGPGDADLAAEAVRRFQQLSAPIAAKAVEDTAFYRFAPLLSRLDVGFDADRIASSVEDFHRACSDRLDAFPLAMLATATHDHKRGEDVRARLAVLSAIPHIWKRRVEAWDALAGGKDSGVAAADRYALYQMIYGCWPEGLQPGDREGLAAYAERLVAWQEKSLREGKLRSSWAMPDTEYETAARQFLESRLDPARIEGLAAPIHEFVVETAGAASANMLVQAGLHFTVPGVPDCYRGCELPDYSMVDPDNRRPVDFAQRQQMLAKALPAHPKLELVSRLLLLRRKFPQVFLQGTYEPVASSGVRKDHVLAFERRRGDAVLRCAFALRCAESIMGSDTAIPPREWWADTQVHFGIGDRAAADLFEGSPVFVSLEDPDGLCSSSVIGS